MNVAKAVDLLTYAEPVGCVITLLVIVQRRHFVKFRSVAIFLLVRSLSDVLLLTLLAICRATSDQRIVNEVYATYFYMYWVSYAVEAVVGFFIIFGIYNLAMAPLPGLKRLGMLMFRWAAGIAFAIAVTMALGPHITAINFMQHAVSQLQQTQSVLTLCMLLFVCLAIRPMGLSYSSKIFGVSLGLGILATTDLIISAWLSSYKTVNSICSLASGVAICLSLAVWTGYFALPEPKRRMIILPTTSPFLRWNQISMALGDEPGFVAIGEVSPDMFAPAEVEVMRRASIKMRAAHS